MPESEATAGELSCSRAHMCLCVSVCVFMQSGFCCV